MISYLTVGCSVKITHWPPWIIIGQSHATLMYHWAPRPILSCRCTCCQLVTWSWLPPSEQCGYRKPINTLSKKNLNRSNCSIIGQCFAFSCCKHCWDQEGVINIHPPFCYLHTECDCYRPRSCVMIFLINMMDVLFNNQMHYIQDIHEEVFVGGMQTILI